MAQELLGKRIAILATDRFEEAELSEPRRALLEAGADAADVIAPHAGSIQGMNHDEVGHKIPVDRTLDEARLRIAANVGTVNNRLKIVPQAQAARQPFLGEFPFNRH